MEEEILIYSQLLLLFEKTFRCPSFFPRYLKHCTWLICFPWINRYLWNNCLNPINGTIGTVLVYWAAEWATLLLLSLVLLFIGFHYSFWIHLSAWHFWVIHLLSRVLSRNPAHTHNTLLTPPHCNSLRLKWTDVGHQFGPNMLRWDCCNLTNVVVLFILAQMASWYHRLKWLCDLRSYETFPFPPIPDSGGSLC